MIPDRPTAIIRPSYQRWTTPTRSGPFRASGAKPRTAAGPVAASRKNGREPCERRRHLERLLLAWRTAGIAAGESTLRMGPPRSLRCRRRTATWPLVRTERPYQIGMVHEKSSPGCAVNDYAYAQFYERILDARRLLLTPCDGDPLTYVLRSHKDRAPRHYLLGPAGKDRGHRDLHHPASRSQDYSAGVMQESAASKRTQPTSSGSIPRPFDIAYAFETRSPTRSTSLKLTQVETRNRVRRVGRGLRRNPVEPAFADGLPDHSPPNPASAFRPGRPGPVPGSRPSPSPRSPRPSRRRRAGGRTATRPPAPSPPSSGATASPRTRSTA